MVSSNSFKFVMLPPQTRQTREWAGAPGRSGAGALAWSWPRTRTHAAREIADAEAAFGTLGRSSCRRPANLRWLQAPQAAPPAGYYYPELIAHPVVVTNFREIYNDHIGAHIMAFVLAFARGLHVLHPAAAPPRMEEEPAGDRRCVHLPETTALIVGVGGIGAEAARLLAAFGMRVLAIDARRATAPAGRDRAAPADALDDAAAARRLRDPDGAAHAGDRRLHATARASSA